MKPETEALLRNYRKVLESVQTAQQAYQLLPGWQFENLPQWQVAYDDLNEALGLAGEERLRPQIATTFVGRLDGVVIAAANPGYGDVVNLRENNYRSASDEQNREFVARFFERYPVVTGDDRRAHRSLFWSLALRHYVRAVDTEAQHLPCPQLWARAWQRPLALGGLDIVPFHSKKDGVTPLLLGEPATEAARLLREIAVESLRMVTQRIRPRLLFIASAAGYDLFDELHAEAGFPGRHAVASERYGLWCRGLVYEGAQTPTRVLSVRWQLFAGGAAPPKGRSAARLPLLTRDVYEGRLSQVIG